MSITQAARFVLRSHGARGLVTAMALLCLLAGCTAPDPSGSERRVMRDVQKSLLRTQCATIAAHVDALPGSSPVLLVSYKGLQGQPDTDPSLATAAFSYDNALAVIALIACDRPMQAQRVAEALRLAATAGRLRNAYRAGVVEAAPLPNGWWSEAESRWVEDAYQMGTATGNVAWVALALLRMAEHDAAPKWREAAKQLARWAIDRTRRDTGLAGFSGGLHGFDGEEEVLAWKSTEHHVDLAAVFDRVAQFDADPVWASSRDQALAFIAAQWASEEKRFHVGTLPDGVTVNVDRCGIDAQLWPLLLRPTHVEWQQSLEHVRTHHAVGSGFDFDDDRDGIWIEGSAQAALVYLQLDRFEDAQRVLVYLADAQGEQVDGEYLVATDRARITTGLAVGPKSQSADFYYYRKPHLAASAWAVLAAANANPLSFPSNAQGVRSD
jgi:hypothetical protein